jgi:hypothetical protein
VLETQEVVVVIKEKKIHKLLVMKKTINKQKEKEKAQKEATGNYDKSNTNK